ncbi:anti-sigma factor antagonist [Sphaerisporangium album]|uniref:Anti-sigma factor antagonist n=1 Tax=Sphaerisporangium album TaxID=509200 RepID=A0A367FJB4_9ACTN|nr:STAS domain-containing protein [Sphaerisporangium album]RCG30361.1 anti-sigma factor antagonist [Sphaerisporangium album]
MKSPDEPQGSTPSPLGPQWEMNISEERRGDVRVVSVSGATDYHTAPRLGAYLAQRFADPEVRHVVLEMSGVEFCDSSGIGALVMAYKQSRSADATFRVARVHPNVRRILELAQLTSILPIYPTVEAALTP